MRYQRSLLTLLLLTLLPATLLAWLVVPAAAVTLQVPQEYSTIQAAVNAAGTGDIIEVDAGTYPENVIVNKTVTIRGDSATSTIVDGGGNDVVFNIQEDNVELCDLTICNGGSYSGVTIYYPYDGLTIRNTRIIDNVVGVVVSEADGNIIEDNVFINNQMYGIDVVYSSNTIIRDNQISESAYGVEISDTSGSQVVNNTIFDTSYGVYVPFSNNNNISANMLSSNSWNIYLTYSNSNIIEYNNVSGGTVGIQVMHSEGNSVLNNTASDNSYGIYLGYCGANTVSGNTASLNDWGIELYNSTGSTIIENLIKDNTWGAYVAENSDGNIIYHNNFLNNAKEAFQDLTSSNTWRTPTTPYQGNYWSNYKGKDTNGDGIGDTYLPWEGVDYYPLMTPWGICHDVAIINVTSSATEVYAGEMVNITVVAENQGTETETFNVTTRYENVTLGILGTVGTQEVINLAPGENVTLTFSWNTTDLQPCVNYTIKAEANAVPGEIDTDDNILIDGVVNVTSLPDVAVTNVAPSKTVAGQGYPLSVNVTVENQGGSTETFNVTACYNSTEIGTQTVIDLAPNSNVTLTFPWNTTTVPYGDYTVSAKANPVPDENDLTDNSFTDDTIMVTIPGDVNGDRTVNVLDAGVLSAHWYPGPPVGPLGYHPNIDINDDGNVDVLDAAIVNANWNKFW